MYALDTYALVEIHQKNPKFQHILHKEFIIPDMIFTEFYYVILKEHNEETANYLFKKFQHYIKKTEIEILLEASNYRYKYRKENLSFFDCVGYIYSVKNNLKFVTGDKQFENRKNVCFIK